MGNAEYMGFQLTKNMNSAGIGGIQTITSHDMSKARTTDSEQGYVGEMPMTVMVNTIGNTTTDPAFTKNQPITIYSRPLTKLKLLKLHPKVTVKLRGLT